MRTKIIAYSDGSCDNHKTRVGARIGGVGIIMSISDGISLQWKQIEDGKYLETNSARMEIRGLLRTLQESPLGAEIIIYIDNQYVAYSIAKGWLFNWAKDDSLESRSNSDLWIEILKIYDRHVTANSIVVLKWIRGHAGNRLNEVADTLANRARKYGDKEIMCKEQYAKK